MEPLYCITARNRLTGERERISKPMSHDEAEDIKLKLGISRSSKRPYTHPKVEVYIPSLNFKQ